MGNNIKNIKIGSVVLDESGTTEVNRKAITGPLAKYFSPGSYSLEYFPLNEGQFATYNIIVQPSLAFTKNALITIKFPITYP
jgi:hypothetical protein